MHLLQKWVYLIARLEYGPERWNGLWNERWNVCVQRTAPFSSIFRPFPLCQTSGVGR